MLWRKTVKVVGDAKKIITRVWLKIAYYKIYITDVQ